MSTRTTAQSVLDLLNEVQAADARYRESKRAAATALVPAYRMVTEEDVDAMIRSLGWDTGIQAFLEDFDAPDETLSGDRGPYLEWWTEGEWADGPGPRPDGTWMAPDSLTAAVPGRCFMLSGGLLR